MKAISLPKLIVSPKAKCAAMFALDRQLIIIPFRQDVPDLNPNKHYHQKYVGRREGEEEGKERRESSGWEALIRSGREGEARKF